MPVLYVFVEKTDNSNIFRESVVDGLFENEAGMRATELFLTAETCGDTTKYALLNAYELLQDTYNLSAGAIFISTTNDPHRYFLWEPYTGIDNTIEATEDEIGQEDWFEQVEFLDEYVG